MVEEEMMVVKLMEKVSLSARLHLLPACLDAMCFNISSSLHIKTMTNANLCNFKIYKAKQALKFEQVNFLVLNFGLWLIGRCIYNTNEDNIENVNHFTRRLEERVGIMS